MVCIVAQFSSLYFASTSTLCNDYECTQSRGLIYILQTVLFWFCAIIVLKCGCCRCCDNHDHRDPPRDYHNSTILSSNYDDGDGYRDEEDEEHNGIDMVDTTQNQAASAVDDDEEEDQLT